MKRGKQFIVYAAVAAAMLVFAGTIAGRDIFGAVSAQAQESQETADSEEISEEALVMNAPDNVVTGGAISVVEGFAREDVPIGDVRTWDGD